MGKRKERAKAKAEMAGSLAVTGAFIGAPFGPVGSAVGGGVGALTGLIIADQGAVFPCDMVAVPAFEYGSEKPSFKVLIKAGETIVPTGPNVVRTQGTSKRAPSKYNREYSKQYKKLKKKHPKTAFKTLVKRAHAATRRALK